VIKVNPHHGAPNGGTRIRVYGLDFQPNLIVKLNQSICSDVYFLDPSHIECTTPPSSDLVVNVTVINPGGLSDTLIDGFIYSESGNIYLFLPVIFKK
jgi:hypothetical protein